MYYEVLHSLHIIFWIFVEWALQTFLLHESHTGEYLLLLPTETAPSTLIVIKG